MPTYAIQAPDGKTYRIDGPEGASDDQVRAEVLRQYPQAAQTQPSERSLMGAIWEGMSNVPSHLGEAAKTTFTLATDSKARDAAGQGLQQSLRNAGDVARGYVQQVRELSPPDLRGSAPAMNTAPAQQAESGAIDRYGVNLRPQRLAKALSGDLGQPNANAYRSLKDDIAEHPLGVIAAAAP